MNRGPSTRFGQFVGLAAALLLIGGGVAFAASLNVTSQTVTTFTAPGPTTTTTRDTRPPALVSLEMFDSGSTPDGFIDKVVATFDEPLAGYTAGTSGWTLTAAPSGRTLTSVSVTAGQTSATLTLGGGTTTKDTAASAFTIALSATAGGIRDAADNRSRFAATAPADRAGPVPTSLLVSNGPGNNAAGRPEKSDQIQVVFSEPLSPPTICSKWTGSGNHSSSTSEALLNIVNNTTTTSSDVVGVSNETAGSSAPCDANLRFGSINLGSAGFVSANVSFGGGSGGNGTSISWSASSSTLSVTLGAVSAATNTAAVTSATTATYTPESAVKDAAGNGAGGSITSTRVQF